MDHSTPSAPTSNGTALPDSDSASADPLLCLLDLQPGMRVLDVGCGSAEFVLRLLNIYPSIEVTGIGGDASYLAQIQQRATHASVDNRLTLVKSSPLTASLPSASFDAVVCVGATAVFDTYHEALRGLAAWVKPNGLVLIANGAWKPESRLDVSSSFYPDHASHVAASAEAGLIPLYSIVKPDETWDEHKTHYMRAVEHYVSAHPADTELPMTRDRIHNLCHMYLRLDRDLLGFGWYLLQNPAA